MQRNSHDILFHGAVAGLLAGAVVALWFLVVDVAAGSAFRTPAELARILFERPEPEGSTSLAAAYSVLHFGTFAVLGVLAAAFLAVARIRPGWLVGLVFGIGVLNAVHYASLLVTGSNALTVLPWPHVVGANLGAGIVLMSHLHRATREEGVIGPSSIREHPLVAQGMVTGLIGAAAVALWFFLLDVAQGTPFRTPAALGSALFLGAEGVVEVRVTPGIVAAYTAFHVGAFALVGLAFVWVARALERTPFLFYLAVLGFILLEAVSFGVMVAFAEWVVGALSLWAIGVGNLVGVAGMVAWLWRARPELRRGVREEGFSSAA